MLHQLDTFTAHRVTVQFSCAVYRRSLDGDLIVSTSNVGPDKDAVEAYAVRTAEAHPDWIVWVVTRTLVTPAWSLAD